MKAIRKRLKAITLFLTVLLLFQSCVVYHKTPTTLEKAAQEEIKTKVTNTNGDIFKYKYITFEEGQFYGVHEPEERGEFVKVPLESEDIINVRTKNKSASSWVTILVITVSALAIVAISLLGSAGSGIGGGITTI